MKVEDAQGADADAVRLNWTQVAVMHVPWASAEAERPAVVSAAQASLLYRVRLGLDDGLDSQ